VSNVLQFIQDYPRAKKIVLNQNYRSTQTILDCSYRLIKNNDPDTLEATLGISKKLIKTREVAEEPVEFLLAERVEGEAEMVADKINELTTKAGYSYKDFAILVRANNHAEPFIRILARKGIPYQFLGPGMLFRQPEVKDLIAYLSVLYNYEDNVAMYRLLSMDFWGLSGRELATLMNLMKKLNLSLFEACEKIVEKNGDLSAFDKNLAKSAIDEKTLKILTDLITMIHRHQDLVKRETAGQILYYFLEDSGMIKTLTDYKTVRDERKVQNIAKFFDKLKTYEVEHEDASIYAVVDFINLSMELGESPLASDIDWTENNAVNILTVHSAKGLEFPVVFLVNLVDKRFPTVERREQIPIPDALVKEILPKGDYHLEEERRLFYVGMTRAKDRLYLTAANYYGEGKREKKLSPFVAEALGVSSIKNQVLRKDNQLSIFDFKPSFEIQDTKYKIQNTPISYLSYSQIDTFNTCPLQYKYRYILRIPTPPSAALSFGDTIHQTMRDFYQRAIAGQNPTKEDLLKILEENWSPLGYPSKAHEEKYKKEGKKILSEFYDKSYDPRVLPLALEQVFAVKISPTLKIGGRIDRIDRVERD
ncbi:MAG: ATP-dependent helicase, partial [Microgenomates group bacterium]